MPNQLVACLRRERSKAWIQSRAPPPGVRRGRLRQVTCPLPAGRHPVTSSLSCSSERLRLTHPWPPQMSRAPAAPGHPKPVSRHCRRWSAPDRGTRRLSGQCARFAPRYRVGQAIHRHQQRRLTEPRSPRSRCPDHRFGGQRPCKHIPWCTAAAGDLAQRCQVTSSTSTPPALPRTQQLQKARREAQLRAAPDAVIGRLGFQGGQGGMAGPEHCPRRFHRKRFRFTAWLQTSFPVRPAPAECEGARRAGGRSKRGGRLQNDACHQRDACTGRKASPRTGPARKVACRRRTAGQPKGRLAQQTHGLRAKLGRIPRLASETTARRHLLTLARQSWLAQNDAGLVSRKGLP